MAGRHTLRSAAFVLLERDGKLLLGKRRNTSYFEGCFGLPSGHLDGGETPVQAAIREAAEEVGVQIDPGDAHFTHVMHRISPGVEYVDFYFTVAAFTGEPQILEPEKCSQLLWVAADDLPENIVPELRQALQLIAEGVPYSEYPHDV